MSFFGIIFFLLLAAVQGALVCGTAVLLAEALRWSHWVGKLVTVLISWFAWVIGGAVVWTLLGGGGGIMDGGIWFFIALPTGIVGSIAGALIWIFYAPPSSEKSRG